MLLRRISEEGVANQRVTLASISCHALASPVAFISASIASYAIHHHV